MTATRSERGCGTRTRGGVYLESQLVPEGLPTEHFLYDPPRTAIPYTWSHPHRSPLICQDERQRNHVVIWVGREFYPSVWDFIEESRSLGASRRAPGGLDFSVLTHGSNMLFVHATARTCIRSERHTHCGQPPPSRHPTFNDEPACLYGGLALIEPLADEKYRTVVDTERLESYRELPCGHRYRIYPENREGLVEDGTCAALFMYLPITSIALVNRDDGTFDELTEANARRSKVPVNRVDF